MEFGKNTTMYIRNLGVAMRTALISLGIPFSDKIQWLSWILKVTIQKGNSRSPQSTATEKITELHCWSFTYTESLEAYDSHTSRYQARERNRQAIRFHFIYKAASTLLQRCFKMSHDDLGNIKMKSGGLIPPTDTWQALSQQTSYLGWPFHGCCSWIISFTIRALCPCNGLCGEEKCRCRCWKMTPGRP